MRRERGEVEGRRGGSRRGRRREGEGKQELRKEQGESEER